MLTKKIIIAAFAVIFLATGYAAAADNDDLLEQIRQLQQENERLKMAKTQKEIEADKTDVGSKIKTLRGEMNTLCDSYLKQLEKTGDAAQLQALAEEVDNLRQALAQKDVVVRAKLIKMLSDEEARKSTSITYPATDTNTVTVIREVPATTTMSITYINTDPPAPRYEWRTRCPSSQHVWRSGYWHWSSDKFVWVSGSWVVPPSSNFIWIEPQYVPYSDPHRKYKYRYIPGSWGHRDHDRDHDKRHR
jgi:hypothetical protein